MAGTVKINIPGVGMVEAQNAATEDTLMKILEAVKKSDLGGKSPAGKAADALNKQQETATDKLKDYVKGLGENSDVGKKLLKDNKLASGQATESLTKFSKAGTITTATVSALANVMSDLAQSAISLTTSFMTSYDDMAKNPIGAGLTVLQTEVDATASVYKNATMALTTGVGTLLGGPIGAAIGAGIGELIGKAIDAGAEMQKMYNEQMSKEMTKSVQTLAEYSKMGASFAGGMNEMRLIANDAGIGMETLSKAAIKSAADLGASGLTHGEATKVMAKGMEGLAKTTGKSGAALRDELMAIGYNYEEQGEVMASYMAQQRAAGKDLKNLAPEELARGARDYAQNLKVISDITGQDAKKLMEKSRAESQRAALMGKLDAGQKDAFMKANSTLSKFGPEVQNALTQFMTLGTVTDSTIAGNANLMKLIQDTASGVSAADANIATATGERMKATQDALAADKMAQATSTAGVAGVTGKAAEMGKVYDNILAAQMGSAEASNNAATAQANLAGAAGSAEKGLADMTKAATNQQVAMEKMTGAELGEFAKRSSEALAGLTTSTLKLQEAINSVHKNVVNPAFEGGGQAIEGAVSGAWWDKVKSWFGGTEGKANGGWVSGDPSGFLEKLHGTELIIPTSGGMIDTQSKGFGDLVSAVGGGAVSMNTANIDALTGKLDELITAIGKSSAPTTGGDGIATAFNGLQDMLAKQLGVHEEMAVHAKDNKDLLDKLLKVSM